MASSSDTRSTRVWLEDTHVALRRPRSAQETNERITFVLALDPRNKQGYDVLLFRPPAATGQKAKAVILYANNWHELEHNVRTRRPYLGVKCLDIHEFDRESLPSDNERVPDLLDKEPAAPRPQSEDSSDDNEPTQHYAPATEQEPASPAASDTSHTYYRGEPRELPLLNEHRSSIATSSQEQQPTTTDMATQTTTITAAMTTVRPSTPPIHRLLPCLRNELRDIYKPLYGEPLEALEDLAALETLPDLEDQEDQEGQEAQEAQEDPLLLQPPQQHWQLQHLPIGMTDSWGVYPSLTREIENSPEHSLTSWFTTSG
jgi:hypothetical protein